MLEDRAMLQMDLERLEKWADGNLMKFIRDVSEVLHVVQKKTTQ